MSVDEFRLDKHALELFVIGLLSVGSYFVTYLMLNSFAPVFIRAGLHGVDMGKPHRPTL